MRIIKIKNIQDNIFIHNIDMLNLIEYNYSYNNDRIVRSTQSKVTINGSETVISKNLENTIFYSYNQDGQFTRKRMQDGKRYTARVHARRNQYTS